MRDVDFHDTTNNTARYSKEDRWNVYPIILKGPYIAGLHADGSINSLPEDEEVSGSGEAVGTKCKGIIRNKKTASKSSSKNPSKKRKAPSSSTSSSHSSDDDDTLLAEDPSITSSMEQLSGIFSDPMSSIGNESLTRTCNTIMAHVSYAVSSDYQRKLRKLEVEINKLKTQVSTHENDASDLHKRGDKLEAEVSTYKNHISDLQKRNDQLVEIYSLNDEASSLFRSLHLPVDDDILLEYLNASLDNLVDEKLKSLSLEELKEKYRLLNIDHGKRIKDLEARISILITEKDEVALRESDAEFEWAAKVLDNARNDLAVNVSPESDHAPLVRDILSKKEYDEKEFREKIESLEEKFSAPIKKVCADHGIPPSTYKFVEIPLNEEDSDISDSEGEYEYDEIEEEDKDSEVDKINEDDTNGK
ncbi:uncharacterized protein LOC113316681 [Papaver somniferum]|uniref:uncharacterized protein LOC113316681 n=1 Tax=Papaver somniferum TaxID=3469 RepID=UPI000E70294C|nr:uncharacterized protein LOC113316681 [Papaver somniferum]